MSTPAHVPQLNRKYRATKECGSFRVGDVFEVVHWSPAGGPPNGGIANGFVRLRQPDGQVQMWGSCGLGADFLAAELIPVVSEIDEARAKITAAIREARALGITVAQMSWGMYEPGQCCCPMTAVAACDRMKEDAVAKAGEKMGWTQSRVWEFVRAFDGGAIIPGVAGDLGHEFRKRLVLA